MPIRLSGADYRRAHEACHKAASLWNFFLASIQEYWKENETDPTEKEMRHFLYEQRPDLRDGLHAHTVQLILGDLMDAVSTYRSNRDSGDKNARAPHREKNYRPLEFTAGFGWRVTPDGRRIALSFGKGHKRIALPLPEIADPKTGEILPSERWGSMQLCWDRNARKWSLHISVPTPKPPQGNPDIIAAIDEGIINPMTVAIETEDSYDVLVVNGRHARAVKHYRNTRIATLQEKLSRCVKGSKRWRKLNAKTQAHRGHDRFRPAQRQPPDHAQGRGLHAGA